MSAAILISHDIASSQPPPNANPLIAAIVGCLTSSTVAEAISRVRLSEVAPGLASQVFVCSQPLETPTGRLMGVVYIQRLLREPPATLLGSILDSDIAPLVAETPLSEVSSYLASYNLLAVPIVDVNERLLGVVTVDDVLDHLLPENWRQDETKRKESESR